MFKQRAAAQKGSGWRCYLNNSAIAVNFLPAMAGHLAPALQNLCDGFDLAAFIRDIRAAGVEPTPGRGIRRIR